MPKQTDIPAKIRAIQEGLGKGQDVKKLSQFVFRLYQVGALEFLNDCLDHDQLPGPRAEAIVRQYLKDKEDLLPGIPLTKFQRDLIVHLASEREITIEQAFKDVISKHLSACLIKEISEDQKLVELTAKAVGF